MRCAEGAIGREIDLMNDLNEIKFIDIREKQSGLVEKMFKYS